MKKYKVMIACGLFLFSACKAREFSNESNIETKGKSQSLGIKLPLWPLSASRCKRNPNDRLEYGGVILFGPDSSADPNKSMCIDKTHVRPILVLASSDAESYQLKTDLLRQIIQNAYALFC